MKKIKIMRLIARLNVGGPARHVIWLTSRTASTFETTLCSGHVEGNEAEMTEFCRNEHVVPVHVNGLGRSLGLRDVAVFFRILFLMRKLDPDIVDTHTAKAGMMGRSAAWILNLFRFGRKKIRTVHTYHGHVLHGYFSPAMTAVFRFIESTLGHFASDRIIVISRQQYDDLALKYRVAPPERFVIVPLGIDLNRFTPVRQKVESPLRIGLVGRLTAIKDPLLFLRAGQIVTASEPRARLMVIGDGELRGEMESVARDNVEFLGNRDDIEALMPTLSVLVISSRNEGTPMSVIEAFASGVVVAATKAGGVIDLLADGRGLLSEIGDADELAANILRLIREPELAEKIRAKALEFVRKEYALERMLADMTYIYKSLCE